MTTCFSQRLAHRNSEEGEVQEESRTRVCCLKSECLLELYCKSKALLSFQAEPAISGYVWL